MTSKGGGGRKTDASEMQVATSLLMKIAFLMLCSSHFQMICAKHAVINDCFRIGFS